VSKLVPSVQLCPYSAAMANNVCVNRAKASSLCDVHNRGTVGCQKLRPGGKRCSKSSICTAAWPRQSFASFGGQLCSGMGRQL